MELLSAYSSDDSSDQSTNEPESNDSRACIKNYFNLRNDDGDDAVSSSEESSRCLDSYELMVQSKILNSGAFGPNQQNSEIDQRNRDHDFFEIGVKSNQGSMKRKYEYRNHDNCSFKVTRRESYKEKDIITSSDTIEDVNTEVEKTIYYTDPKITDKIDSIGECFIPRHQFKEILAHESAISSLNWCIPRYSHLLMTGSFDHSVKIWDLNGKNCRKILKIGGAVRAAKWSHCGTSIICGGFDKKVSVFDVNSGKNVITYDIKYDVSSIEHHPLLKDVFLVGSRDTVLAFDKREPLKPIRSYDTNCKYVLDMAFMHEGREFICSTELVAHDSSDKTIMVWDFESGAILSNQIYSERYTCPCIRVKPGGQYFAAQSNGDYMVMFSTRRPYKMLNKRYAGHKLSGYGIGCDFSNDGQYLASGDATGKLCVYSAQSSSLLRSVDIKIGTPIVRVAWHPVFSSTVATAGWDGSLHIWR